MLLSIANYYEADRRTARAGADIPLGALCKVGTNAAGERVMNLVTADADTAKPGNYAMAFKVSAEPLQVSSSTVVDPFFGIHLVSIKSGDLCVEARRGTIMSYDPSLLDASLDPARSGVLPNAGDSIGVKAGYPCATSASSALVANIVMRCYNVVGGQVRIELL